MKRITSFCLATLAIVLLLVTVESRALAFTGYVDPGTGLLALQYIASAFAASLFFMRRRIAALFGKKSKAESTPAVLQEPSAE